MWVRPLHVLKLVRGKDMTLHAEAFQAIHASIDAGGRQVIVLWSPANVRRLRTRCEEYEGPVYWRNDPDHPGKAVWKVKAQRPGSGIPDQPKK